MAQDVKGKTIDASIKKSRKVFGDQLGIGTSFDVGRRSLLVLEHDVDIYFVNGLTDSEYTIEIIKKLVEINDFESEKRKLAEIIKNRLMNHQVEEFKTYDDAINQLLSGLVVVTIDGESFALVVDVRNYPGRGPKEPDTEKVVRGARDGFTENIIENSGLTRRRIRDDRLRMEIMRVGERSQTDVSIAYLKDVADPGLVDVIKKEISKINVDGMAMSDKALEEFLVSQSINPFPLVRYTERPDVASAHLFEGHVLIYLDTSPSVMITPTTFFHHVQHAEESRQVPSVGTFIRWVRFFGVILSIFLLPLWVLFATQPEYLPPELSFIGLKEEGNLPIIVQVLLADIGLEFMRIAAIHTPTALSTAMGLIAAVLIGEIAITVGLFSPEIILYVAISAIGTYSTPSHELGVANKLVRIMLVIAVSIWGAAGFIIGVTLYLLHLVRTISLNTPYFWPLIPFNGRALWHVFIRMTVPHQRFRPSIVHPQSAARMPKGENTK